MTTPPEPIIRVAERERDAAAAALAAHDELCPYLSGCEVCAQLEGHAARTRLQVAFLAPPEMDMEPLFFPDSELPDLATQDVRGRTRKIRGDPSTEGEHMSEQPETTAADVDEETAAVEVDEDQADESTTDEA